jgi:deazaflavin-dependent oxidoreductase (nitroreductase family)
MTLTGEYAPSTTDWVRENVEEFESSGGTRGNELNGRPIVVVTSVGAVTGKLRKNPVMRVEHDGQYAVVASKGGAPTHPSWYHNIVAQPLVQLQDGPEAKDYVAHIATGREREEWWKRAVAAFPPYAQYQTKTDREIPVFVLTPA